MFLWSKYFSLPYNKDIYLEGRVGQREGVREWGSKSKLFSLGSFKCLQQPELDQAEIGRRIVQNSIWIFSMGGRYPSYLGCHLLLPSMKLLAGCQISSETCDGWSTWALAAHVRNLDGILGSWIQPHPVWLLWPLGEWASGWKISVSPCLPSPCSIKKQITEMIV